MEIYVQQIVVEHVQQINWQMNLHHKDYGKHQKQEKLIQEIVIVIVITTIMVIINKRKIENHDILSIFKKKNSFYTTDVCIIVYVYK